MASPPWLNLLNIPLTRSQRTGGGGWTSGALGEGDPEAHPPED
jgi:hypothetical protein